MVSQAKALRKLAQNFQIRYGIHISPWAQTFRIVRAFPYFHGTSVPRLLGHSTDFTFSEPCGSSPRVFMLASNVISPALSKPELLCNLDNSRYLSHPFSLSSPENLQEDPKDSKSHNGSRCIEMYRDASRCIKMYSIAVETRRIQAHASCPGRSRQESQPTRAWTDWTDWTETGFKVSKVTELTAQSLELLQSHFSLTPLLRYSESQALQPFTPGFAPWAIASRPARLQWLSIVILIPFWYHSVVINESLMWYLKETPFWGGDFKSSAGLNHLSSHVEDLIEAEWSRRRSVHASHLHKLGAMLSISQTQP